MKDAIEKVRAVFVWALVVLVSVVALSALVNMVLVELDAGEQGFARSAALAVPFQVLTIGTLLGALAIVCATVAGTAPLPQARVQVLVSTMAVGLLGLLAVVALLGGLTVDSFTAVSRVLGAFGLLAGIALVVVVVLGGLRLVGSTELERSKPVPPTYAYGGWGGPPQQYPPQEQQQQYAQQHYPQQQYAQQQQYPPQEQQQYPPQEQQQYPPQEQQQYAQQMSAQQQWEQQQWERQQAEQQWVAQQQQAQQWAQQQHAQQQVAQQEQWAQQQVAQQQQYEQQWATHGQPQPQYTLPPSQAAQEQVSHAADEPTPGAERLSDETATHREVVDVAAEQPGSTAAASDDGESNLVTSSDEALPTRSVSDGEPNLVTSSDETEPTQSVSEGESESTPERGLG